MNDEEARRYVAEREEREAAERARCTGPDGRYVSLPPTRRGLLDLVGRARGVDHGSWMRPSPSGYWIDLVAMGRELLALRAVVDAIRIDHDQSIGPEEQAEGVKPWWKLPATRAALDALERAVSPAAPDPSR